MDVSLRELPGDGDGQGGLACCDSWGRKESTRLSDWTELIMRVIIVALIQILSSIFSSFDHFAYIFSFRKMKEQSLFAAKWAWAT